MSKNKRNIHFKPYAQRLRKGMTPQERKLWYLFLSGFHLQFHRQYVIESYIVDFYCPAASLVVELDGSQHYEEDGQQKDVLRDARLHELGITVARYSNREVDCEFDAVCEDIRLRSEHKK